MVIQSSGSKFISTQEPRVLKKKKKKSHHGGGFRVNKLPINKLVIKIHFSRLSFTLIPQHGLNDDSIHSSQNLQRLITLLICVQFLPIESNVTQGKILTYIL